jgi:hypothetical protein
MIYYNVLTRPILLSTSATEPEYLLRKNLQTKKPDLDEFTESHKCVGDLKESLDKKEKRPDSLDPMVETTVFYQRIWLPALKRRPIERKILKKN